MANYLNEEQNAQLMNMLNQQPEAAPNETPTPENAPAEDIAAVDAAAPAPVADPSAALFAELGVKDVNELAARFKESDSKASEYKEMLAQILAFQQALDNNQELDTNDPMNSVKKAVREEMAPVYDKLQRDAQNKLVQEAWGKDAREMPDIADVMPDIAAFIQEHPELAVANDGLRRAYDSVRSAKYRSEEQMLKDDEFVQRMASNEKVRELVLKEHLSTIARNGEAVPTSIGEGGGTPLTGQKQAPSSMEKAKVGLGKMLGMK